jgi:peptidoglycan hydrolase CwlO-like protein
MELLIRQTDNQKIINIIPNEYSSNALAHKFADDETEESVVKDVCYFIEKDIEEYAKDVDNILHNYQDIKERIGDKKLKEDNKKLKKWISDTHKELYELKKNMYGMFETR